MDKTKPSFPAGRQSTLTLSHRWENAADLKNQVCATMIGPVRFNTVGGFMSRLRRLYVSDRFFFVTCQLHRGRRLLDEDDFTALAEGIQLTRQAHGFLLTGWVFLPDHWHAVIFPRHPMTLSRVMEIIKVRSTHKSNLQRCESGPLWQARFFDHALED